MDVNMPDAELADFLNQPNQPNEPGPPDGPEPRELDQPDQDDQPDVPEADPNDLFDGDVKEYRSSTFVILDATEAAPAYGHDQGESIHQRACRMMEITIRNITNIPIIKVYLPNGATQADFDQAINNLLAQKTKRDLMIWYYHGSAGGEDRGYKWRFARAIAGHINAYDFIDKLCNSDPDSMILPDCYIHDKHADMWPLNTGNIEIFTVGGKLQSASGNMIHAHDGYLSEAICRDLNGYLNKILGKTALKASDCKPRSIPQAYGKDYRIKNKTQRIWFSETYAGSKKLCLRFRMDPMDLRETRKISFKSYCIGPKRPPPPVPAGDDEEEVEDEGYAEMEDDGNEMFVGQ